MDLPRARCTVPLVKLFLSTGFPPPLPSFDSRFHNGWTRDTIAGLSRRKRKNGRGISDKKDRSASIGGSKGEIAQKEVSELAVGGVVTLGSAVDE